MARQRSLRYTLLAAFVLVVSGCASPGPSGELPDTRRDGERLAAIAAGMIGAPYRYGGSTPHGFDCSGLVQYAHLRIGLVVPRTTRSQWRLATPVAPRDVSPGDLLFFALEDNEVSHVGIYAGRGRFIHAPSKGKRVTEASLHSRFWRDRVRGAGRFH